MNLSLHNNIGTVNFNSKYYNILQHSDKYDFNTRRWHPHSKCSTSQKDSLQKKRYLAYKNILLQKKKMFTLEETQSGRQKKRVSLLEKRCRAHTRHRWIRGSEGSKLDVSLPHISCCSG